MNPVIITRPQAQRGLSEIHTYIAERSPRATERFLRAADAAFAELVTMPGMGRRWGYAGPGLEGVSVWLLAPQVPQLPDLLPAHPRGHRSAARSPPGAGHPRHSGVRGDRLIQPEECVLPSPSAFAYDPARRA